MATIGRYIVTLVPTDVGTTPITAPITVKRIHVLGDAGTVAGHAYRLEDPDSNLLYRSQANGAYYESESITQRQWKGGVKVITLASGAIDIEFESPGENKY